MRGEVNFESGVAGYSDSTPEEIRACAIWATTAKRRDHDTLPEALQPFSRALAIHDALPDEFRPSDDTALRECLAGVWPTVSDLRALVTWGTTGINQTA